MYGVPRSLTHISKHSKDAAYKYKYIKYCFMGGDVKSSFIFNIFLLVSAQRSWALEDDARDVFLPVGGDMSGALTINCSLPEALSREAYKAHITQKTQPVVYADTLTSAEKHTIAREMAEAWKFSSLAKRGCRAYLEQDYAQLLVGSYQQFERIVPTGGKK
jgi:hypothetical protein